MRTVTIIMTISLLLFPVSARSTGAEETQLDLNNSARVAYDNANCELNNILYEISKDLSIKERALFNDSQIKWIKYRDLHSDSASNYWASGSIYPYKKMYYLESLTRQRIEALQKYYKEYDNRYLKGYSPYYKKMTKKSRKKIVHLYDELTVRFKKLDEFEKVDGENGENLSKLKIAQDAWINYRKAFIYAIAGRNQFKYIKYESEIYINTQRADSLADDYEQLNY